MTRFRWVWWSVLSWMGLVPDIRDRPGDEQWLDMPHLLDRFNEPTDDAGRAEP